MRRLLVLVLLPAALRAQAPTVAGARTFLAHAESTLYDLGLKAARADWVANTYITFDTQELSAEAEEANAVATRDLAMQARRYERLRLPPDLRRSLRLLKLSLAAPPPPNPREASELTRITTSMQADYGRGKYCKTADTCLEISDIEHILATSRDPAELLDAWQGWHRISVGMRDRYARFVTLANAGAKGFGFADVGALWRSGYDMPADSFIAEVDRLWTQMRPLYLQLHAYVRGRLLEKYGSSVVPPGGMIPIHLLGNIWGQKWDNIYDLVAPPAVPPSVDVTALLRKHGVDE